MRLTLMLLCLLAFCSQAFGATLLDLPLSSQINIGLGDAISDVTWFMNENGVGFCRKLIATGDGAGGWYNGQRIDFVKAGAGSYLDLTLPDTVLQYTARYYQGGGNTNPYSDAPIFARLHDANSKSVDLGISYGPRPNPQYPEWITCAPNLSIAEYDPSFDLSKVVAISFYGTNWDGAGEDYVDIRDLVITNSIGGDLVSIAKAKTEDDGTNVQVGGAVSAVFPKFGQFYIQDSGPTGIQVRTSNLPASAGGSVVVNGTVRTDAATKELYIDATEWTPNGAGVAKSFGVTTKSLGGIVQGNQQGVEYGSGLNNVGLLVRIYGEVTGVGTDKKYFYLSDGAPGITDDGAFDGVRVDLTGVGFYKRPAIFTGDKVIINGISSMYAGGDGKSYRSIKVADFGTGYTNLDDDGNRPKVLRVAVVNFDPYCPGYGNRRTHSVLGWNNPQTLANGYINDLKNCSGNWLQYQIVSWFDADYHPLFEDGFQYTGDSYVQAWNNRHTTPMHSGTSDYIKMMTDRTYMHNRAKSLAARIADDEIDEVFLFGAPYGFAGWESAMAGPSPFFINGGSYFIPSAKRNFPIMGFNYERGVDCMLENFCHRTECVMSRVYNPRQWWFPTWPATNNWDKFRMYDKISAGNAACGICHYAPNSLTDYDWGNKTYVYSTCDDWLYFWPDLKGDITKRLVNDSEWGSGDMRLHHLWWLNHLPKAVDINPDGKQNNWWKYSADFNSYPESR